MNIKFIKYSKYISFICSTVLIINSCTIQVNACAGIAKSVVDTINNKYTESTEVTADKENYTTDKKLNLDSNIDNQLDSLYEKIANKLDLDKSYIKELHLLAGGKVEYTDKIPNIYNSETVKILDEPMKIKGAKTKYQKAEFIKCEDEDIDVNRPSKYYLPDAIYSVSYDIASLMSQRLHYNRGSMQIYFDSLIEDVKKNILFYEAVLLYTGEKEENVNNFYRAYEKMLYDKHYNENIVTTKNGKIVIKDKFKESLKNIGIKSKRTLNNLALLLSFDDKLAINDNDEVLKEKYIVPYKLNYTSRENMMIAAMCLVGKVRYVWAGGHSGASYIDGINPVWEKWNSLYPDEPYTEIIEDDGSTVEQKNEGFGTCIKPSGSWCPLHGYSSSECSKGKKVYSLEEYVSNSAEIFNKDELLQDKYREMLSKVDYSKGISVHTLDGLDCSGFSSWLYNQITDKYEINSVARSFAHQNGTQEIIFGSKLLPGDTFSWTTHIVVIVGQLKENSKAYVTVEQTPSQLKFGVVYYTGAYSDDINEAKQIAKDANSLIGGINGDYEEPHVYCMNNCGFYKERMKLSEAQTDEKVLKIIKIDGQEDPLVTSDDEDKNSDETDTLPVMSNNVTINEEDEVNSVTDNNDSATDNSESLSESTETVELGMENDNTEDPMCTVLKQQKSIGRFRDKFIDEDTVINEYNVPITEMYAKDIIQYTLTKLPISYVLGFNEYQGELFVKDNISSNLGINTQ